MPHGANASSTISSRPVLATERGDRLDVQRRDRPRVDQLDRDALACQLVADRERLMNHQGQGDDRDVGPLADDRRLAELDHLVLARGDRPLEAKDFTMLQEEHRIVAPERALEQAPGIARVDGTTTRRPGNWANIG